MTRYYVGYRGGSKHVTGWKRAVRFAIEKSKALGYASIRQSILDGYRLLAEYRNGLEVQR